MKETLDNWNVKETLDNWNVGGKLIFIATVVAVLSMFMKWVALGHLSASGFQKQGYLFLVFYLYPVIQLFRNKPINKIIGIILAVMALVAGIGFMLIETNVELLGQTINVASTGLYVYIISTILLIIGVYKYE